MMLMIWNVFAFVLYPIVVLKYIKKKKCKLESLSKKEIFSHHQIEPLKDKRAGPSDDDVIFFNGISVGSTHYLPTFFRRIFEIIQISNPFFFDKIQNSNKGLKSTPIIIST